MLLILLLLLAVVVIAYTMGPRAGLIAFVVAVLIVLFAGCGEESPTARPYTNGSIWNDTIAQKGGTLQSTNTAASEFGTLFLGGGPGGSSGHDHDYAKPTYLEAAGDSCYPVVLRHTDWNTSNTKIPAGACVPNPAGTAAAPGTDGHLTIISADLHTAWSFWRAKFDSDSGTPVTSASIVSHGYIEAANGSVWHIHPDDSLATGVASCCGAATGRGSGTELLTTVLKQDEAEYGIRHALGFTIPGNVHSGYVNPPAIKSDGNNSSSALRYGMLFALRPSYTCPSATGVANLCQDLKDYGAFLVDQGSVSGTEIDTTGDYGTQTAAKWQSLGITRNALPLAPSDWRCVDLPGIAGECPGL
jgi:hypothetical protein